MNPRGLRDLDPLGNHEHPCASRAGVYIGFRLTYIYLSNYLLQGYRATVNITWGLVHIKCGSTQKIVYPMHSFADL